MDILEGKVLKIRIIRPGATRVLYDPFVIEVNGKFNPHQACFFHVFLQGIELVLGPADSNSCQNETQREDSNSDSQRIRIEQLINRLQMVGQQQGLWSSYSSSIITQIVQNIQVISIT